MQKCDDKMQSNISLLIGRMRTAHLLNSKNFHACIKSMLCEHRIIMSITNVRK
jgi:hypothetical protein